MGKSIFKSSYSGGSILKNITYAKPIESMPGFNKGNLYEILEETETEYKLKDSKGEIGIFSKADFKAQECIFNEKGENHDI